MSPHKYPTIHDIGLVVHDTFETTFKAFDREWHFAVRSQSEANIAQGCLSYYSPMWKAKEIKPVSDKDLVLDVGAHVGFFTVPISSQVSHVVALEPAPANFQLLKQNIARNGVGNVTAIHSAMSKVDGVVELNLGVSGTTGHSVTSKKRSGLHAPVQSMSLGAAVQQWAPSVLKLDCEGAEWEILSNARWLTGIRIIIAELHKVTGTKLEPLETVLQLAGYTYTLKSNSWFSKLVAHKEI